MVNFYISYEYMGADVAHLCERNNTDGTYDRIFLSQFGPHTKIRTSTGVNSPMRKDIGCFKPTSGTEFITAYVEVTNNFQRLTTSLFQTFSLQYEKE